MKEIRIHGRGGQGSVTAAELVAASAFNDGRYAQAFPSFGVERRGAPVTAFARIDDQPIRLRSQVYEPDYIIVQDATLLEVLNVFEGMKRGVAIINTETKAEDLKGVPKGVKVYTVPATQVAIDIIGRPIVNTMLLGYFAGLTGEISLKGVKKAVSARFEKKITEKNLKAVDFAFKHCGKETEHHRKKAGAAPYMQHRFGTDM